MNAIFDQSLVNDQAAITSYLIKYYKVTNFKAEIT